MIARTFLAAIVLAAGTSAPVLAWEPAAFEVFCGKPAGSDGDTGDAGSAGRPGTRPFYEARYGGDVDIPQEPGCLTEERAALVSDYAARSLAFFRTLGFASPSPYRLGPVVEGADGQPRVRIFVESDREGIASTRSPCSLSGGPVDPAWLSIMRYAPRFLNDFPPPRALHIVAHEVFHVVQNAQPYMNYPDTAVCANIPDWLTEGMADAMGAYVAHQRFPGYRPALTVVGAPSFYGLRPYDRAFTWWDETVRDRYGNLLLPHYRTASFWQHLTDHYYRGDPGFLADFLAIPDLTLAGDDWLDWLDGVLRSPRPGPGHPFSLIFADFLANYAMWGRDKFPHIGEDAWLESAFGGCETVSLSPGQPTRGLELELEMISGRCLRVVVGGLAPGDLAQVKVMADGRTIDDIDSLHLATALLGGRVMEMPEMEAGCYRWAERVRGRPACLVKPYTGTRDGQSDRWMRTWSSPRQEAVAGGYENLYVLAHAPAAPKDGLHGEDDPAQKVRLVIGLDHARMETAATGPVDKATAAANGRGTETLPMKGGESTGTVTGLMGALIGQAMGTKAEDLAKLPFALNVPATGGGSRGLSMVEFTANDLGAAGTLSPTYRLILQPEAGYIPFGQKGRYRATVLLTDEAAVANLQELPPAATPAEAEALGEAIGELVNRGMMGGGKGVGEAEIEVIAYDDDLLHLRASGTYCHLRDADRTQGGCRAPKPFEAELITPFGWVWDAEQAFVSADSAGMQDYRGQLAGPIERMRAEPEPEPAAAPREPAPATASYTCTCTCAEYDHLRNLGPLIAAPATSAAAMQDLLNMQTCPELCMEAWMSCIKP